MFCTCRKKFVSFNHNFYEDGKSVRDLGAGRELIEGFQKNVKLLEGDANSDPVTAVQIDRKLFWAELTTNIFTFMTAMQFFSEEDGIFQEAASADDDDGDAQSAQRERI